MAPINDTDFAGVKLKVDVPQTMTPKEMKTYIKPIMDLIELAKNLSGQ